MVYPAAGVIIYTYLHKEITDWMISNGHIDHADNILSKTYQFSPLRMNINRRSNTYINFT